MRVLIVEEDAALKEFLAQALSSEGYEVGSCARYEQAPPGDPDLIMLDVNGWVEEGMRVSRAVRCRAPEVLLIGLGMRLASKEVAGLLDAGADDYVAKPFSFAELSARIRALQRRSREGVEAVIRIGDLCLDRMRRRVERAGRTVELTGKEFSLLEFLMLNTGRRVTRTQILEHVWHELPCPGSTNLVDVYIAYLRKKVDGGSREKLIHTARRIGYEISLPACERSLPAAVTGA